MSFFPVQMPWAVLLRVWRIPQPEVPPGHVCIPRHSSPAMDLNHGYSRRKSCNAFVVRGLAAGFCLASRFRCFPLPLHLNQEMCFLNSYNGMSLNVLRWFVSGSDALGCSAARLADTPARSASRAHLHSAAFQPRQGSEPRAQSLKILQCVCCERFGCQILSCGKVQMLPFTAASEPGEILVESV